ncbi:AT-rich interactive domain-containing protein 5A [Channa argus]|uniref:AT-rich interactive domain-containing protein 5A n=1 Tax=Channa argus TaxID=215402 RepID=A0A6G1QGJ3_CHAAH|nr:AT-rich interactive domain-containing protein 5A [Channa argus]
MLFLSMETQAHVEMAHREVQKERAKALPDEITEEQFLKDLYLFMKKRDTPIERIPHLGFKQIDLFVMFKTVRDLGGYHQVTAQQLWKQVYNTLGGNPRSTSAATCTRRHYEKLLLPYECHVKGIIMSVLPPHHPKPFHYYNKDDDDDDDGQRPAKRKLIPIALSQPMTEHLSFQQSPYNHHSNPHQSVFPLPFNYSNYPHPSYTVLPSYVNVSSSVLTPHSPPSPHSQFAVQPSFKGPLEQLRNLANRYKYTAGLSEPLNLSVKSQSQETNRDPVSSFSVPSSTKNPKFLNKPSPLYAHHRQMGKNEHCETQDSEAADGGTPILYPVAEKDAYIFNFKSASSSPTNDCGPTLRTNKGTTAMPQNSSSPKQDFTMWPKEDREAGPGEKKLNLSQFLPSLPQNNGGKMEIEIPLSVLQEWLRLSSAKMQGAKQLTVLPTKEEQPAQKNFSNTDILSSHMSPYMHPHHQSPAAEDLRMRPKNQPSPTTVIQTTSNQHNSSKHHFTNYKPLPLGGILKNVSSRDVCAVDQQNIKKSYTFKNGWDTSDKETEALKVDSSPLAVQQDVTVIKHHSEDTAKGGKERSEMRSSAVVMVDSSPASVLHLTTEELMKLKKIISSSL